MFQEGDIYRESESEKNRERRRKRLQESASESRLDLYIEISGWITW